MSLLLLRLVVLDVGKAIWFIIIFAGLGSHPAFSVVSAKEEEESKDRKERGKEGGKEREKEKRKEGVENISNNEI